MIIELMKKFTNNYKEVPLFFVTFNLDKFRLNGKKGSCDLNIHPELKQDKYVVEQLNKLVDHIRDNYDMEKLSK